MMEHREFEIQRYDLEDENNKKRCVVDILSGQIFFVGTYAECSAWLEKIGW